MSDCKPNKTFFWYFKPLGFVGKLLGVFPMDNILSHDSKHLRSRIKSFTHLYSLCIFTSTIYIIWQFFGFFFYRNSIFVTFIVYTMLIRSIVCFLFCMNYSKKLSKLIKLLDNFDKKKDTAIFNGPVQSVFKKLILWTFLPLLIGVAILILSFYESSNVIFEIMPPSTPQPNIQITSYFFGLLNIWQIIPFLLYIYFSLKIKCNFDELNWAAKKKGCAGRFLKDNIINKSDQNMVYKTLEHIRFMHSMLSKSVMVLSKCYGNFMALDQLCVIAMIVVNICTLIYDIEHELHLLVVTVISIVLVFSAIYVSHSIKESGNKIVSILQGILFSELNKDCQIQIQMFMLQIAAHPVEVSAAGFFIVDKSQISSMMSSVATYLIVLIQFLQKCLSNLQEYTGHSFRRSSATLLANSGADLAVLKRHGGWRSNSVVEGYIEDSLNNKIEISRRIIEQSSTIVNNRSGLNSAAGSSTSNSVSNQETNHQDINLPLHSQFGAIFSNLNNCNFYISSYKDEN